MRILITGSNGFIGRHLAIKLIEKKYEVVGLGRNKDSTVAGLFKYYSGTVLDKKLVKKAIQGVGIVVHLAALTSHSEIIDNKFESLETNFFGTKNVLDAFSKGKAAKKFIYSSTGKVYGRIKKLPITEQHPTDPVNILGKSKFITEKLIHFYNDEKKDYVIFRIFNIYGPNQKENFLIPTILRQLRNNEEAIVLGDTKAKRDYLFIDDLIEAFLLVIENKKKIGSATYNICTGIKTDAQEIVRLISKIMKRKIVVRVNTSLVRSDEMKEEYGSYRSFQRVFGWSPKFSLIEGMKKIINP